MGSSYISLGAFIIAGTNMKGKESTSAHKLSPASNFSREFSSYRIAYSSGNNSAKQGKIS
jgi:hypothetical protein